MNSCTVDNYIKKLKIVTYNRCIQLIYQAIKIVCCLDFGFFEYKSNKRRIFWKSVTIIQSLALCLFCVFTIKTYDSSVLKFFIFIYLTHYFLNVLIFVLFKSDITICKFFNYIELIDLKMGVANASYNFEKKMFIAILLNISFRTLLCVANCIFDSNCLYPAFSAVVFMCLVISLDFGPVSYSFVFYALNCRLKKLASILETVNSDYTFFQYTYKSIVELAEMYKSAFGPVLLISLLFSTPEIMFSIYIKIQSLLQEQSLTLGTSGYFTLVISLVVSISPVLCAGMLSTQANKIIIILQNKLLKERDKSKIYEIRRFIDYVEARGCRFRVFKVLPLDSDLVGMVLNFCVTYLIVALQFTNK